MKCNGLVLCVLVVIGGLEACQNSAVSNSGSIPNDSVLNARWSELHAATTMPSVSIALPDETDKAYWKCAYVHQSDGTENFNELDNQKTRRVCIEGKTLILDTQSDPQHLCDLLCYDAGGGLRGANNNLKSVELSAETVIIRGRIRLPECNLTINARRLIFDDSNGISQIDTSPLDFQGDPPGAQRNADINGSMKMRGVTGKAVAAGAGNITLNLQEVIFDKSKPIRFILQGGRGQNGGQGLTGPPGPFLSSVPGEPSNLIYLIVYLNRQKQNEYGTSTDSLPMPAIRKTRCCASCWSNWRWPTCVWPS
jgi:hypothetical protein